MENVGILGVVSGARITGLNQISRIHLFVLSPEKTISVIEKAKGAWGKSWKQAVTETGA